MSIPTLKELALSMINNIPRKKEVPEEIRAMIMLYHMHAIPKFGTSPRVLLDLEPGKYSFWGVQVYRRSDWTLMIRHQNDTALIVFILENLEHNLCSSIMKPSYSMPDTGSSASIPQPIPGWHMLYMNAGPWLVLYDMVFYQERFIGSQHLMRWFYYDTSMHIANLYINYDEKESDLFETDMLPFEFRRGI